MSGDPPRARDGVSYLFVGGPLDGARIDVVHRSNPDLMRTTPEPPDEIHLDEHDALHPVWFSRSAITAASRTYRRVDDLPDGPRFVYQEFPDT